MLRRAQGLRVIGPCRIASNNVTQLARSLQRLNLLNPAVRVDSAAFQAARSTGAFVATRLYATDAATQTGKARGRPKKPASEKTTATKPRAKRTTTAKSTTAKRPVTKTPRAKVKANKAAKPKKKKVVKPKPKKKVLTEAGKLRKEKKDKAEETKALKLTALLKDEPKKGHVSPYAFFNKEFKGDYPDIGQRARVVADAYKGLSSSELEQLNHRANDANKTINKDYTEWVSKISPTEVVKANNARKLLRRRGVIKKGTNLLIKDDRLPKQPVTAYAQFSTDRFASGDFRNIPLSEASKLISKEWNETSDSGKQKYRDLFEADKKRYEREYKSTFGGLPSETDTGAL